MDALKVGKRGAIIVPAKLRKRYGIEEGTLVTAEPLEDGVLIRPAVVFPVERYSPERKAEFPLSSATNEMDWPILLAALESLAAHLMSGDFRHFGPYFGHAIEGILVMSPAQYLKDRRKK